jgi:WD40 repeat protein
MLRLQGVKKPVQAVAFSPDGKTLASGGGDYLIRLWEHGTGKQLDKWAPKRGSIFALAFSPDGKVLASGYYGHGFHSGGFHAWSLPAHEQIAYWSGGYPDVTAAAFSPDGKALGVSFGDHLSFDGGGGFGLWETSTWRLQQAVRCPAAQRHHTRYYTPPHCFAKEPNVRDMDSGGIRDLRWTPDGKTLVLATGTAGIVLWDVAGKEPRLAIKQPTVRSLDLSAAGSFIVAADSTRAHLYDMASRERRATFKGGHKKLVWSVAISPDGALVLTGAKDGVVCLWEAASGRLLASYNWDIGTIHCVRFAPDGMTAAVAGHAGAVILWDVDPSDLTGRTDVAEQSFAVSEYTPERRSGPLKLDHKKLIKQVAFSPDGKHVASVADNLGLLWNALSGKSVTQVPPPRTWHCGVGPGVAFTPDSRLLLVAGSYPNVFVWDVEKSEGGALAGEDDWVGQGHPYGTCTAFALSADGTHAVCGVARQASDSHKRWPEVVLWHAKKGGLLLTLFNTRPGPLALAFSPNGGTLAVSKSGPELFLWDVFRERKLTVAFGPPSECETLCYSPDGRSLLAGTQKHGILFFDPATGEVQRELPGHKGGTRSLSFSPDGTLLLTGGADKMVRLWDLATGQQKVEWDWQLGNVNSVMFGPAGTSAVCGTQKGFVVVWDFDSKLVAPAK